MLLCFIVRICFTSNEFEYLQGFIDEEKFVSNQLFTGGAISHKSKV